MPTCGGKQLLDVFHFLADLCSQPGPQAQGSPFAAALGAAGGMILGAGRDGGIAGAGAVGDSGGATEDNTGLTISDAQFGAKIGRHAKDFGLDPSDPEARQVMREMINDTFDNPDEVRVGPWNPKGGGGEDYRFYRQGSDVVVTTPKNDFVTILKNGEGNGWFERATPLG